MAVRVTFEASLIGGPSTERFLIRYATLFDINLIYKLRKGAPLLQMLEAPEDFIQGSAEPWIVDIVCALLRASDQRSVVECGAFMGVTSLRLCRTLAAMGGGNFTGVEIDPERAAAAQARLESAALPATVKWQIVQDDVLKYLASIGPESVGFAFVDDDHEQPHVFDELNTLLPKMIPGGLVTGHDVWGSCALHEVFGRFPRSISLDLPRLGPAGGLGIIQA